MNHNKVIVKKTARLTIQSLKHGKNMATLPTSPMIKNKTLPNQKNNPTINPIQFLQAQSLIAQKAKSWR